MNHSTLTNDYISKSSNSLLDQEEDKIIIDLIAKGDQIAFRVIYQRYKQPIFNFIYRLVHDLAVAEELLQEVFLGIWKSAHRFRGDAKVSTWMFKIAYNQCATWLRHHRNDIVFEEVEEQVAADNTGTLDILELDQLRKAIRNLSLKHRAVIEMSFAQGMSYVEISKALGIPIGTVKSRMSYAYKAIAQSLNELRNDIK